MSTRPMLTQREAARACGVSRTTIRRRREAGELPGAVQDEQRGWLIPVEDLLAAGFRLNAPAGPDPEDATADSPTAGTDDRRQEQPADVAALRAELEHQRLVHALELATAEHGRLLAESESRHLREQLAAQADHIGDLRQALAALSPAPDRAALSPPAVPAQARETGSGAPQGSSSGESAGGERRRWWRRG
ncbi:helix-turn-helix domain-containing protein [Streptomyces sp. NPDC002526]